MNTVMYYDSVPAPNMRKFIAKRYEVTKPCAVVQSLYSLHLFQSSFYAYSAQLSIKICFSLQEYSFTA